MKVGYIALLAAFAAAPAFAADHGHGASGGEQAQAVTVDATGKLNELDATAGRVNITHAPIAALGWPAMTMDFVLAEKGLAAGLKGGETVRFTIRKMGQTDYVISAIEAVN